MSFQLASYFTQIFASVARWLEQIFEATGMAPFVLSMFAVYLSVRYLLGPLMFSSGSDKAKKKKDGDK